MDSTRKRKHESSDVGDRVTHDQIIKAVETGDLLTLQTAIDQRMDLFTIGNRTCGLLEIAIVKDQSIVIPMLVSNGINADFIWAAHDITPLLLAVQTGTPAVVHALLKHGANVLYQDEVGNTVFHYLPYNSDDSFKLLIFKLLITYGGRNNICIPNERDEWAPTPLVGRSFSPELVEEISKEKKIVNNTFMELLVVVVPIRVLCELIVEFLNFC